MGDPQGGILVPIKSIRRHPQYTYLPILTNDIALIELQYRVQFNSKVSPACLPSERSLQDGDKLTILGWGTDTPGGKQPNVLQKAQVGYISPSRCLSVEFEYLRTGFNSSFINDKTFCGGGSGKLPCNGDGGGPGLFFNPGSLRYESVGVTSFGASQCRNDLFPEVFTR